MPLPLGEVPYEDHAAVVRRVAELEQENRYLRSQLSADVGERCDARLAMLERARRAEGEVARLRAQLPAQVGLAAAAVDELARLRAVLAEPSLEERRRLAPPPADTTPDTASIALSAPPSSTPAVFSGSS